MSLVQAIIVFGVSWWMILFMALPIGVKVPDAPEKGHAASSPDKINLKQKLKWVTILAFGVTMMAYILVPQLADAAPIHQTNRVNGHDCAPLQPYQPIDNVEVKTGEGASGTKVQGADLVAPHPIQNQLKYIDIPLELPIDNYVNSDRYNADLSATNVRPGTITLDNTDRSVRFNGVNLSDTPLYNPDCIRNNKDSVYSTK